MFRRVWSIIPLLVFIPMLASRAAAPSNDNFNNAISLTGTNVTASGTNVGATKEIGEPSHGANQGGRSVWWKWTAPASGSVIVQTEGSDFDTLLGGYTGSSLGTVDRLDGNDDNGSSKTSAIEFNVSVGVTYNIAVDGFGGAAGNIQLSIRYRPATLRRPLNDNFENRVRLTGPVLEVLASNFLATKQPDEPHHASEIGGASVWWSWTAPTAGKVTLATEGSNFDTLLAVYTGSILTNLTLIAQQDDIRTNQPVSQVTFDAEANTAYAIAVDGFNGQPGEIQLRISMDDVVWLDLPRRLGLGIYQLKWTASPGKHYVLETSSDLRNWAELSRLPDTNGVSEFSDSPTGHVATRFYRIRQLQ